MATFTHAARSPLNTQRKLLYEPALHCADISQLPAIPADEEYLAKQDLVPSLRLLRHVVEALGSPGLLVKPACQPQVVVPPPQAPSPRVVVRASVSPDSRMSQALTR